MHVWTAKNDTNGDLRKKISSAENEFTHYKK